MKKMAGTVKPESYQRPDSTPVRQATDATLHIDEICLKLADIK
jgi:hypothetical protein